MPTCIDVYGAPVKGCSKFYEELMIDQGATGNKFECSYHPSDEKVLSPGGKEVLMKNDLRYMNWAIVLWITGGSIIVLTASSRCFHWRCLLRDIAGLCPDPQRYSNFTKLHTSTRAKKWAALNPSSLPGLKLFF